ncbi:MAG: hypothetical protein ACREC0_10320 [Methylocella sp.]
MAFESKPPHADEAPGVAGLSSCVPADDRPHHNLIRRPVQAQALRDRARTRLRRRGLASSRLAADGSAKRQPKKKTKPARPVIEISGDVSGLRFESEFAAIARALKGSPFIAAGNYLRVPVLDRSGAMVTTRLRTATIADIRHEARKRVRFVRIGARSRKPAYCALPLVHCDELIRRAGAARLASICSVWLRVDSKGRVIASSPPLHFGQTRKFADG